MGNENVKSIVEKIKARKNPVADKPEEAVTPTPAPEEALAPVVEEDEDEEYYDDEDDEEEEEVDPKPEEVIPEQEEESKVEDNKEVVTDSEVEQPLTVEEELTLLRDNGIFRQAKLREMKQMNNSLIVIAGLIQGALGVDPKPKV